MIFIWPHWVAFKILVPWPVMGPMLPAEEAQSLPWTSKECQAMSFWKWVLQLLGSRPFGKNRRLGSKDNRQGVTLPSPPLARFIGTCFAPTQRILSSCVPITESGFLLGFQLLRATAALAISGRYAPGTTQPSPPSPSAPTHPKAISFIQNSVLKSCISMTPITQIKTEKFSRIQICKNIWIFD